jgi:hypothetical protein
MNQEDERRMPSKAERQQLARKIRDAFSTNDYPGDDKLVVGDDPESLQIRDVFKGKRWEEIPLSVLDYHYSSLSFFSPEAYRYYLPAFLLASVLNYRSAGMVPLSTILSLIAPKKQGKMMMDWFLGRVSGLTPAQKAAIREFLEFMYLEHGSDFPNVRLAAAARQF